MNLSPTAFSEGESAARHGWAVGSDVEVFSNSQRQWCSGVIVGVLHDHQGEWLEVKYDRVYLKEIQRFSGQIRPLETQEPLIDVRIDYRFWFHTNSFKTIAEIIIVHWGRRFKSMLKNKDRKCIIGYLLNSEQEHINPYNQLKWSPVTPHLFAIAKGSKVEIWRVLTDKMFGLLHCNMIRVETLRTAGLVSFLSWSPNGTKIIASTISQDDKTGREVYHLLCLDLLSSDCQSSTLKEWITNSIPQEFIETESELDGGDSSDEDYVFTDLYFSPRQRSHSLKKKKKCYPRKKQGWIARKYDDSPSWHYVYAVATEKSIKFYRDDMCAEVENELKFSVISGVTISVIAFNKHTFVCHCNRMKLWFATDTEQERREWCEIIKQFMNKQPIQFINPDRGTKVFALRDRVSCIEWFDSDKLYLSIDIDPSSEQNRRQRPAFFLELELSENTMHRCRAVDRALDHTNEKVYYFASNSARTNMVIVTTFARIQRDGDRTKKGRILCWNMEQTRKEDVQLIAYIQEPIRSMVWFNDEWFIVGLVRGGIEFFHLRTNTNSRTRLKRQHTMKAHHGPVYSMSCVEDMLLTASMPAYLDGPLFADILMWDLHLMLSDANVPPRVVTRLTDLTTPELTRIVQFAPQIKIVPASYANSSNNEDEEENPSVLLLAACGYTEIRCFNLHGILELFAASANVEDDEEDSDGSYYSDEDEDDEKE